MLRVNYIGPFRWGGYKWLFANVGNKQFYGSVSALGILVQHVGASQLPPAISSTTTGPEIFTVVQDIGAPCLVLVDPDLRITHRPLSDHYPSDHHPGRVKIQLVAAPLNQKRTLPSQGKLRRKFSENVRLKRRNVSQFFVPQSRCYARSWIVKQGRSRVAGNNGQDWNAGRRPLVRLVPGSGQHSSRAGETWRRNSSFFRLSC